MTVSPIAFSRGGIGRAGSSSLVATATDYGVFSLLLRCGCTAALATLFGCLVGGIVNFTVNRKWAFRATSRLAPAALRYALVSGASAMVNALLVDVITVGFGMAARPTWGFVRFFVFMVFTFPLFRAWVFVLRGNVQGRSHRGTCDVPPLHAVAGEGPVMQWRRRGSSGSSGVTVPAANV